MTWNAFRHREETLRAVTAAADARRDGVLPSHVPGVADHFADELDLLSALLLKWHTRLSGNLERVMSQEPMDLSSGVVQAWRVTAEQMPGVRMVIDRCTEAPRDSEMERALRRAQDRERVGLALAAGLANGPGQGAIEAGHRVELLAREGLQSRSPEATARRTTESHDSLVDRIKAALAA